MAEAEAAGAAGGAVSTTESRLGRQTAGLILDAMDEGVYGVDVEGRITFLNPAAVAMLGWSVEQAIGADMHALVHHSLPDGSPYPVAECPIQDACRRGVSHTGEHEVLWSRSGEPVPVTYTATPLRDGDDLVGGVVVFTDIRDRLELDRERLASAEGLAHLARPPRPPRRAHRPRGPRLLPRPPRPCPRAGGARRVGGGPHVRGPRPLQARQRHPGPRRRRRRAPARGHLPPEQRPRGRHRRPPGR